MFQRFLTEVNVRCYVVHNIAARDHLSADSLGAWHGVADRGVRCLAAAGNRAGRFCTRLRPALSTLTEAWRGPSAAAMTQAVGPYVTWLRTTAQQCQQLSSSAQVAAAAFGSTLVSVVHPSVVTANRRSWCTCWRRTHSALTFRLSPRRRPSTRRCGRTIRRRFFAIRQPRHKLSRCRSSLHRRRLPLRRGCHSSQRGCHHRHQQHRRPDGGLDNFTA